MRTYSGLNYHHKGLDVTTDYQDIWSGVSNFLSLNGINAYIYHHLPAIGSADYARPYSFFKPLTSASEESSVLSNAGFEKLLRKKARALITPKSWKEWGISGSEDRNTVPPDLDLYEPDTAKGISIPVHGPMGRNGCVSIEFDKPEAELTDFDVQATQSICQSAHQNICRLFTERNRLDIPKLTDRETQILTWIALGKSNVDIANILNISSHTVGTYTRRIFDKTKTNNRTSAALCGISNGLIYV
jgi:DNA-binding CsgD family transcriptional regulator